MVTIMMTTDTVIASAGPVHVVVLALSGVVAFSQY